jgi:uncharacterized protein (DUF58 family)
MSTSGFLGWLNIRGIDCHISFSDEIYCNCPTLVTLKISNSKRFLYSYLLSIKILDHKSLIISVPRGGTVSTSFVHTFNARGRHELDTFIVSSPFPVNFFVRGMEVPVEIETIVFPNPVGTGANPFKTHSSAGGELQHTERGFDGEMITIADYTGVEPLKQIHWRLSARHDWFKVKELGATAREPVILDLTAKSSLPLEDKLSKAAFLVNRLGKFNGAVGLKVTKDRVIQADSGRGHRLRILRELALFS